MYIVQYPKKKCIKIVNDCIADHDCIFTNLSIIRERYTIEKNYTSESFKQLVRVSRKVAVLKTFSSIYIPNSIKLVRAKTGTKYKSQLRRDHKNWARQNV